jgi:lipopolysaccharide/colanic/teichoic acid biosynthesis glycosyltransferase
VRQYIFYDRVKRFIDVVSAFLALLIFSPLFIFLIILTSLDGGPPFFKQVRLGHQGRIFVMWKFRSMVVDADNHLKIMLENDKTLREDWDVWRKLKIDPRTTVFGKWLRRLSLDELPQLWNVLKGDMSLVGPRPILPSEVELWGGDLLDYQSVRPGITGLWQVSGRSKLTYEQRISLDLEYIHHRSWMLDTLITLKTIRVVFLSIGAH